MPLYLAFPPNRHVSGKLRVFIEWVAELIGAACAAVASAALKQRRRRILENPGVMVSGQGSYMPRDYKDD